MQVSLHLLRDYIDAGDFMFIDGDYIGAGCLAYANIILILKFIICSLKSTTKHYDR